MHTYNLLQKFIVIYIHLITSPVVQTNSPLDYLRLH